MCMRKIIYLFTFLCFSIGMVLAQTKTASGTITSSEDGEPVVGASVLVKGAGMGMVTDADGKFNILNIPASATTLEITYIGMETLTVGIGQNLNLIMNVSSELLDEVIIVAYGTTTKKSFTGSASVIKSDVIAKSQSSNISNNIAGRVAGVQGLSSNGQPGSGSTLRIRGVGSMNSSNNALYVVDGVPYGTSISSINNNDIESMTVLKDAAATALYGARGANGVVLITTKRGKTRDARINVDVKWGNNSRGVPQYKVMKDPGMYYETYYRAMYNSRISAGATKDAAHAYANRYLLDASNGGLGYQVYSIPQGERLVGSNFKLNPNATPGYVDVFTRNNETFEYMYLADNWYDEVFNASNLRQEYNVDASGSIDNIIYRTSFGYLDDSGIIPNSGFERFTSATNIEYKLKDYLKLGSNIMFAYVDINSPSEQTSTNSSANLFFLSSSIAPIYPMYIRDKQGNKMTDRNGFTLYDYGDASIINAKRPFMNQANPMSALQLDKEYSQLSYFVGNWFAELEPIQDLKLKASLGYISVNSRSNELTNKYYGQYASFGGIASVASSRFTTLNQQYSASYLKTFRNHTIDLLGVAELFQQSSANLYGYKYQIFQDDVAEVGNAITEPNTNSYLDNYSLIGYIFQAKYNFRTKYYLSASYRLDGSSCFHPDNRWGSFWSVGGAWDLRGEDFMSDFDKINLLKVKASYGALGNDKLLYPTGGAINYKPYQDQFNITENNGTFATARSYKGNSDITWETSLSFNTGVDFSLFDERLNGSFDYFQRNTKDQLYYRPVSPSLGYDMYPMNIGTIRNSGFEFDINGDIISTNDLVVNGYFNITHVKNKIVSLHESLNGEWISGSAVYKEGNSLYNFYLREYAGVNPDNGESLWYIDEKDADGNVTGRKTTNNWSDATRYEQGDRMPKFYGGFGTNVEFKGLDLSISFGYQLGGKIYDNSYASFMHSGYSSAGQTWHQDILNMWTEDNKTSKIPRINTSDLYTTSLSDRFIVSSDYLSLQNISIGYSLPSKLINKYKLEKVRIYGVADNVALLSARTGLDPRQGYTSSNTETYSTIRSISGGISVTF